MAYAHAKNGRISTSGLKSDVTTVFLNPEFFKTIPLKISYNDTFSDLDEVAVAVDRKLLAVECEKL